VNLTVLCPLHHEYSHDSVRRAPFNENRAHNDKARLLNRSGFKRFPLPNAFLKEKWQSWTLTLIPRSRVLLEKLAVPHLVKTFSTFYRTQKFHHCVHNGPPLVLTQRHMNQIHSVTPYFFGIHFNNIQLSMTRYSLQVFRLRMMYTFRISPVCASCLTPHTPVYKLQVMKVSSLCNLFHPPATSSAPCSHTSDWRSSRLWTFICPHFVVFYTTLNRMAATIPFTTTVY
jgi:hypothetical protein